MWRVRSSNEIKSGEMLNVFSKGKRKSYDCFAIEVRLKNRTLSSYRSTYPYGQRRSTPRGGPGYLPNLVPLNFCGEISRHFSVRRFLWGNFQAPHKQRFGFCDSSLTLRWHLRRHFCETLHVLRSDKQTCGHDLKVSGKKASKYKSEGNFSDMKKLLMTYKILAW